MTRMSDIVGASGLAGYAIIALVLFVAAFALAMLALYAPGRVNDDDRLAQLPFDEGTPVRSSAPEVLK